MAYRNDRRDNYDRRTRTGRDASPRPTKRTSSRSSSRSSSRPSARTGSNSAPTTSSRSSRSLGQQPQPTSTRPSSRTRNSRPTSRPSARTAPESQSIHATPGGLFPPDAPDQIEPQLVSTSVGELRRAERAERLKKSSRRYLLRFVLIIGIIVALLAGWAVVYNSPAFTIANVKVNGVSHLTDDEVSQLANVPEGITLLRVDTDSIANRMKQTAWVDDVEVKRVFPDTLEINVTERTVQAIVEIPTSSGSNVKQWAIADDHIWLMPIPDANSEAAKTTSSQIYADAEAALHIVDVPYGTKAEIGKECTDSNVNNALDIVSGMTTELSDRVIEVSAAGPAETTLILDNGVEIAFGKAEDIRDKERVILKILEENPDGVAYINVRMVETPTWRAV